MHKKFASLDALKTAVSEECELAGRTWKFLYPWNGSKRPAAFICGCEVSRVAKESLRVEQGVQTSCRAEGVDASVHVSISSAGVTTASARCQQGSASVESTFGNVTRAGQNTSPVPVDEAEGKSSTNVNQLHSKNRFLDFELKVHRREACSFFVVRANQSTCTQQTTEHHVCPLTCARSCA